MKFLKLSLAASVALGALSTASFAQPLEEATATLMIELTMETIILQEVLQIINGEQ